MTQLLRKPIPEAFPLFFSFGLLMGIVFIGIWPAYGLLGIIDYPGVYHAQGAISLFIGSFAIGFLLTALPRFTGSFSASISDVIILFCLIFLELYLLMTKHLPLSSFIMAIKFIYILYFGFSRARNKTFVPPPSFIWIIFALISVIAGGLGTFFSAQDWFPFPQLAPLFRSLIFHGFITSLFLGIGGRLMPFLTEMPCVNEQNQKIKSQLFAAILFFSGLILETFQRLSQIGFAIQTLTLIFIIGYLWKLTNLPGNNTRSRLLWASSWLLVGGPLFSTFWPNLALHFFHLTFIGCFLGGTLTVAAHVIVSHKNLDKKLTTHFWPLGAIWLFVFLAALTRSTAHIANYVSHLGYAGLMAIIGLLIWAKYFSKPLIFKNEEL